MKTIILDEAGKIFRPEFINRLDEMIVFRPLSRQNMTAIVGIMLEEVRKRLAGRGISFSAGEDVTSFLLDRGYQPKFGARPLRRAIQTYIEDRLADFLLEKRSGASDKIEAYIADGNVAFRMISGSVPGVAEAVNHQ